MSILEAWYCPVIFLADDPAAMPNIYIRKGSAMVQKPLREKDLWDAAVKLLNVSDAKTKATSDIFAVNTTL